jgi:hypothetical protein
MEGKIFSGLKKFAEGWKGILAIAGAIGVISTTAIFIDHWKNNKTIESSKIEHSFKYDYADSLRTKDFQDTVIANFRRLANGQERIGRRIEIFSVQQDSLKSYFIRKAVTKQDMKDIMNIWGIEKKNNETSMYPTVLKQNK